MPILDPESTAVELFSKTSYFLTLSDMAALVAHILYSNPSLTGLSTNVRSLVMFTFRHSSFTLHTLLCQRG